MQAETEQMQEGMPLRFGFTVSKRNARRAVDRGRIKRVMREAVRHALPRLRPVWLEQNAAATCPVACHVVLRLKAPLPPRTELSLALLKKNLRREADQLLQALHKHLRSTSAAVEQPQCSGRTDRTDRTDAGESA